MFFGLDGVEIGLIVVFLSLFSGIMTGYPVAFAIGGAAIFSFVILAVLGDSGFLLKEAIDTQSLQYKALIDAGLRKADISLFRYPELPTVMVPLFEGGSVQAINRTLSFIVNRINERVLAGPAIETLLAVAMFVLMGIALERSKIANDLLTTMARVFGPLPGGLAVSVVLVGAFLAASTGIVGATVVTMGLLSLPTMLRNKYSPELATGVIAASGTLGQVIPPSIVIVLLGTLAGDLYSTGQEHRAREVGCSDALTYLGEAAVLSVGTLFKAAILPGIFLAFLYGLYAFGYALWKPQKAPPVFFDDDGGSTTSRNHKLMWFLGVPIASILFVVFANVSGVAGGQSIVFQSSASAVTAPELRTNVSESCKISMIELHGQEKWDRSVVQQEKFAEYNLSKGKNEENFDNPTEEQIKTAVSNVSPLSMSLVIVLLVSSLLLTTAFGVRPLYDRKPLLVGGLSIGLVLILDYLFVNPLTTSGTALLIYALPFLGIIYGLSKAFPRLGEVDVLRVVFPPLVLIIAVLGSILGGITNPTPAAALGAAGAIMLAAQRRMAEQQNKWGQKAIIWTTFAIIILLLLGVNFDLRSGIEVITTENKIATIFAEIAYVFVASGLFFACWVLFKDKLLTPVVEETAKVTSMVFAILIGSQMLNLVLISFGGEHYIQDFLKAFDDEWTVFLLVMVILFILGFVLDFLEIIYIVIPIVGPVIYGGSLDPKWVTIMIAINLQTSFLTPPFGFALFYLRGVAPKSVTTKQIYKGVLPFVGIQVIGLAILWAAPSIVTILPDLFPGS